MTNYLLQLQYPYLGRKAAWVLVCMLLFTGIGFGISPTDDDLWMQSRRDENGIVIRQMQTVRMHIDDQGTLNIAEKVYEETLHLKHTARFFSEQSVNYSSTFSEIREPEAYSLVPNDRGRFKKHKVDYFKGKGSLAGWWKWLAPSPNPLHSLRITI